MLSLDSSSNSLSFLRHLDVCLRLPVIDWVISSLNSIALYLIVSVSSWGFWVYYFLVDA